MNYNNSGQEFHRSQTSAQRNNRPNRGGANFRHRSSSRPRSQRSQFSENDFKNYNNQNALINQERMAVDDAARMAIRQEQERIMRLERASFCQTPSQGHPLCITDPR